MEFLGILTDLGLIWSLLVSFRVQWELGFEFDGGFGCLMVVVSRDGAGLVVLDFGAVKVDEGDVGGDGCYGSGSRGVM
ncbi:hypothetical protein V6N11_026077 [Hibiscus sabdariffa]|uniref:Uncharacterized protein n=1 Tax=Hibiscus sabdariffa TaxID=183260 RepID=A0ABR2SVE0_9ROSI